MESFVCQPVSTVANEMLKVCREVAPTGGK